MQALASVIVFLGIAIGFIAVIWMLIQQLQDSIFWVIGSIFIPIFLFLWVAMYWPESKKPFLFWLLGMVIAFVGIVIAPDKTDLPFYRDRF